MSRPAMPPSNSLVRIVTSYIDDLGNWLKGAGTRYAAGIGLAAAGALSLIVAVAVGTAAAFHWIDMSYGPYTAYAIIGGAYGLLGLSGLIAGRALLGRPLAPPPSPHRQVQMFKRALSIPMASLLLASNRREPAGPDLMTQVLAAGAAATLLGWVAATHLQRRQGPDQK